MAADSPPPRSVEELREAIRPHLPPDFFARNPARAAHLLAAFGGLAAHMLVVAQARDLAWFPAICALSTILSANALAFAFFYFHEAQHGAVFDDTRLRFVTSVLAGTPFLLTPTVWRRWHGHHHRHTSMPEDFNRPRHPEFDDVHEPLGRVHAYLKHLHYRKPTTWVILVFGIALSHAHAALANLAGRNVMGLDRGRTLCECTLVLAMWCAPLLWLPADLALAGWLAPVLLANAIASAYVISNHCDSPVTAGNYPLVHAKSVYLVGGAAWSHMHFGRHVEHHLFPSVTHDRLAVVTRALRERFPGEFEEASLPATIGRILTREERFPPLVR